MKTFLHSGRMGDILYSLYYVTHVLPPGEQCEFVLKYGVSAWDPSGRPHMMERDDALFLYPLLFEQPYIRNVYIYSSKEQIPGDNIELDGFRRNMYVTIGREIRTWYYPRGPVIPEEFSRKVLTIPESTLYEKTDRIAICFTPRYVQGFPVDVLRLYRDRLVFVGLPREYSAFCSEHFAVEYLRIDNALDLAMFMASCAGFVGNVSGTFAIAECAKLPRVLCLQRGGGNVRVYGNGKEAGNEKELVRAIEELF